MLREVGGDRDNEVIIFTGTGDHWVGGIDRRSFAQPIAEPRASRRLTHALTARVSQRRLIEDLRNSYTHQLFAGTRR